MVWKQSLSGCGLRNRVLCFLLNGLGILGEYRQFLRKLFPLLIGLFGRKRQVCVKLNIHGRKIEFCMRKGDREDYLVAGKLISGGYRAPDRKPHRIIDGGANIGAFAVQAWAAHPEVELICYEPDEANCAQLVENLSRNNIEADIIHKGLWSS